MTHRIENEKGEFVREIDANDIDALIALHKRNIYDDSDTFEFVVDVNDVRKHGDLTLIEGVQHNAFIKALGAIDNKCYIDYELLGVDDATMVVNVDVNYDVVTRMLQTCATMNVHIVFVH